MRCESVASYKNSTRRLTKKFRGGQTLQKVPREGTQIRIVYDIFMAEKGKPVSISFYSGRDMRLRRLNRPLYNSRIVQDLTDYYGLDIRKIKNGTWVLAGEWFGATYVDYIAEHIGDKNDTSGHSTNNSIR